jgi:hypothetical protein
VAFHAVTWNQIPFQYSIINALAAAIGTADARPATVTCTEGYFTPATNRPLQ